MKLHIISDTHITHPKPQPLTVCADALVLAGDIVDLHNKAGLLALTADYREQSLPVIYVLGNHEFYQGRMPARLLDWHRFCKKHGIFLLHNREVVIDGVRFLGTTLWTDYELARKDAKLMSMRIAEGFMADHSVISFPDERGYRMLRANDCLNIHNKAIRLLDARLSTPFDGPTVVVTHHGVSPQSIASQYRGHPANPAFISNLEPLIQRTAPALWVHGHVHSFFDYSINNTRVIVNPHGYIRRTRQGTVEREVPIFNDKFVVEV